MQSRASSSSAKPLLFPAVFCLATLLAGGALAGVDSSTTAPGGKFSVLCAWDFPWKLEELYPSQRLKADVGAELGAASFAALADPATLKLYNVVVLFEFSRVNDDAKSVNHCEAPSASLDKIADTLLDFVRKGGGLYIYGCAFTHMGDVLSTSTLNDKLLRKLDAKVLFEELHDPGREKRQNGGRELTYTLADLIASHRVTDGVKNLWLPVGRFAYGPWLRPLQLGKEWTTLVETSKDFTAAPCRPEGDAETGKPSAVSTPRAAVFAVRQFGEGRIVLDGGESTASFFGYGFSEYADQQWGRVRMERGLEGVKSDGLRLFENALAWLAEPSAASGAFGGYVQRPAPPKKANEPAPITWKPQGPIGKTPSVKGSFGAIPAIGGGSGEVAEYAAAAKKLGMGYLVVAGLFEKMERKDYERLAADCAAASSAEFAAIPALITLDDQNNSFLQCGPKSWSDDKYLSKKNPKRVADHLGYWMVQCNFPARVIFNLGKGGYPGWLHSGYDAIAVKTFENGVLVEDATDTLRDNCQQGDRPRVVCVDLVTSPDKLGASGHFTHVLAPTPAAVKDYLIAHQFGGMAGFVSNGPLITGHTGVNSSRNSFGVDYVPGTERARLIYKLASDSPLKTLTIHDGAELFRRIDLGGVMEAQLDVDCLHDTRHSLTLLLEDTAGRTAVAVGGETGDRMLGQCFCSDRCNIMGGWMTMRDDKGAETTSHVSSMLYKAGRLYFGTAIPAAELPGVDGSGAGTEFSLSPVFSINAEGAANEPEAILHHIKRPLENAGLLIFDTPIERRSTAPAHLVFGHNPYVDLIPTKSDCRLVQYHYYRNPGVPSTMVAEMTISFPTAEGVKLKAGWNGFSIQAANAWGSFPRYTIVRADGWVFLGPSSDEKAATNWRGRLMPGDSFFLPDQGEGFHVLPGSDPLDIVVECMPSKKWFRLYTGSFDAKELPKGGGFTWRLAVSKIACSPTTALDLWKIYGRASGLSVGNGPVHDVKATRGKVAADGFELKLEAANGLFIGTIASTGAPRRLPARVAGVNPKWTAAVVDLDRGEWTPVKPWNGETPLVIDTAAGPRRLAIGNLVSCPNPDLLLTLLPGGKDGAAELEAHNPTDAEIETDVSVTIDSFLAKARSVHVKVPPRSSARTAL